jgi:dephospho-CoA kinase
VTTRIGLTGPIGCGKSTVAGWLRELGAVVIDADEVAREVVEPGTAVFDAVVAAFGEDLRLADGRLDRAALGRIVFSDAEALARLEAIIHPAVRPRIMAAIHAAERSGAPAIVVEAIKLVEGGLANLCDEIWLVVCDPVAQRRRLQARGLAADDAERRIGAQADPAARLAAAATRTIDAGGSLDATRSRVLEAWTLARLGREDRGSGVPD